MCFVAAIVAIYAVVATQAPAVAHAGEGFCDGVTLAPYGQWGDRCYAWEWQAHSELVWVTVRDFQRSGCADYAPQYSGELKSSWACFAKETWGYKWVSPVTTTPYRGVIRNNNLSYNGTFDGEVAYFSP